MDINYVAVVVAALVSFFIGWAWYSPILFVKPWLRSRGKDPAVAMSGDMKMPMGKMLAEFVSTLLVAYVLAHFSMWMGVTSVQAALQLAVWIWLGFQATLFFGQVQWEEMRWRHFAISSGRWLVTLVVMSLILGLWH